MVAAAESILSHYDDILQLLTLESPLLCVEEAQLRVLRSQKKSQRLSIQ